MMKNKQEIVIDAETLYQDIKSQKPLLVFDLRAKNNFVQGHIEGSVHAVCDARAKDTIMPRIPKDVKIVLVDEDGKLAAETAIMMKSYGFDAYYLKDGIKSWNKNLIKKQTEVLISPQDLWAKLRQNEDIFLVDVRQPEEFSEFHIPGSINIPLAELFSINIQDKIPKGKQVVTICPHGNRSMVAAFALVRKGIEARSLTGGLAAWGQVLDSQTVTNDGTTIIQVEKIGKGCLSYIVGSDGQALVIDPVYPAEKYLEFAKNAGLKIIKVADTHQHADHVSAARYLAKLTGSELYMSKYENYDFESKRIGDGDVIKVGKSTIKVIHTPGHTAGSLSYLLDGKYVFTGDVLFVEGIGRPDLRNKAKEFASDLYNTLHKKLLTLPQQTKVLPAHHGENVERKNGVFVATINDVKRFTILKLPQNEFVIKVAGTSMPKPMNYEKIIQINKSSAPPPVLDIANLEIGPNRCSINAT